jgi:site-specific DNA recombinase
MAVRYKQIGSFGKIASENPYEGCIGLVYARVSSKRQEVEGTGLQSQDGRCIKDLAHLNVPYDRTFPDSFTGGGDFMNRPAMKDLLRYIDANPHKRFVVVFDDLKRFARDVEFHLKLRAAFAVRNVLLRCLNYNFDDSPEGKFAELIMAGQAELERHQNRRQVIQKQAARLNMGYWAFGSKKGYKMTKHPAHGMISVPNNDGYILQEALVKFADATLKRKIDVCIFLVEKGFWKKQRPEKYIDKVAHILNDAFYAGFIEYPVWEIDRRQGHHEALISFDTFNLIQKRLKNEQTGKRIRRDITDDFQLRGLLVCGHCHKHLTASWSKGTQCTVSILPVSK